MYIVTFESNNGYVFKTEYDKLEEACQDYFLHKTSNSKMYKLIPVDVEIKLTESLQR